MSEQDSPCTSGMPNKETIDSEMHPAAADSLGFVLGCAGSCSKSG